MSALNTPLYSELDVRNMLDAAVIRLLKKQEKMIGWGWNDISDVICQEVMRDHGKEPKPHVVHYQVGPSGHHVLLSDGTIWSSWACQPWTQQGMPPKLPWPIGKEQ